MQHLDCNRHGKPYQLIGSDDRCALSCLICMDCLRAVDSGHKKGISNHQTISAQQLSDQFHRLQKNHYELIQKCTTALDNYFRLLQNLLRDDIQRQKQKISRLIRKILLVGVTRDDHKMNIILNLYQKNFSGITCQQVNRVSDELFRASPPADTIGFAKFIDYLQNKQAESFSDYRQITQSKTWNRMLLKNIQNQIMFPYFQQPLRASRVRTQQSSPKRTLRKSAKKQLKNMQFNIQLKKPLQLGQSKLVQNRQQASFLSKLFQHRNFLGSTLLYRASQNNFSVKEFHRLCDGQTNTLVLAKTQFGKIIGGFTPIAWKSTANTLHSDIRGQSFLFSLSLKQKMALVDQKSAVFNSVNFGPTFGAGADLAICHNADKQKTSYSQFPYSYANNRYRQANQHSTALFTGQKNGNHFLLKQWQVWKINFSD